MSLSKCWKQWVLALAMALPISAAQAEDAGVAERRSTALAAFAGRELKLVGPGKPNPTGWVDAERWCIAHARLASNTRIDEASRYFAEVTPVSASDGLIADTDVQVTDLLRSYLQFKDTDRLTPAARKNLESFFTNWVVPNNDRNRKADVEYEWPGEYTENHTLNILVGAYLIDVALGRDRTLRRGLLQQFLRDRARWGWSEFHSPNYGMVTAKALTCLVDFAPDKPVADAARMTLDVLALEYANESIGLWRGVPFARGAGRESNNASNSFFDLMSYWFADPASKAPVAGDTFLPHVITSTYRPPVAAGQMIRDNARRGTYTMHTTATHGPARLRVPIEVWASPQATIASAQGFGSYYSGCYWTISFASDPRNVITGNYAGARNILQRDNVLATFGTVTWHGGLKPAKSEQITLGGDEQTWAGQIDLADDAHVLMIAPRSSYASSDAFRAALLALSAEFKDGILAWKMPDGRAIKMINEREGKRWRLARAFENDRLIRLDTNLLYGSPHLQSVRGSGVIEAAWNGQRWTYDFRDAENPRVIAEPTATLTALPAGEVEAVAGMKLLHVGAGDFVMGSGDGEGRKNEQPRRWVDVPGFYISRTEVTVGQWKQYLTENSAAARPPEWFIKNWGKTDEYPMTWVTWEEALAFCEWLSKKSGKKFTLPTEAQWEKAARGYSPRAYPWGDFYDGTQAGTPNTTYAPVASKPMDMSELGVMDMSGNVFEWCADWYDDEKKERVVRGAGWNFDPDTFRCAYRTRYSPGERAVHIGFRVVREE